MTQQSREIPKVQRIIAILWPSFLTACVATIVFFTVFDPVDMMVNAGYGEISRLGGYTAGFFFFWLLTSTSCALTCYFQRPCEHDGS